MARTLGIRSRTFAKIVTYLERRHPGRWAKRQNVDVTSKEQPIRTVEVVRAVRADEA